ncbi:MFS transporter [Paenibacillus athensensis]|uniref:MFS transporter n=1 Tax=Paenibacillus athensensis TaxID=1967502 RepID=A0A4Y8Q5G9_9BACL|nr:MFS transporter [Paenibacillus athensensis]MCD1259509.1 MFS transporter [Paenibacillus athensensis]
MKLRWLIRSQSIATLAAGMIYPYYLLFLKNLGNSYSKYGLAFAVFTISSAAAAHWLAPFVDRHGRLLLALSSFGMTAAMLLFPWAGAYIWVLGLQLLMGLCAAMQKMSERLLLADHTEPGARGRLLGSYQFWTSVSSGFAVVFGGYLIDWLTIDVLFYLSALLYALSGWAVLRAARQTAPPPAGRAHLLPATRRCRSKAAGARSRPDRVYIPRYHIYTMPPIIAAHSNAPSTTPTISPLPITECS